MAFPGFHNQDSQQIKGIPLDKGGVTKELSPNESDHPQRMINHITLLTTQFYSRGLVLDRGNNEREIKNEK